MEHVSKTTVGILCFFSGVAFSFAILLPVKTPDAYQRGHAEGYKAATEDAARYDNRRYDAGYRDALNGLTGKQ